MRNMENRKRVYVTFWLSLLLIFGCESLCMAQSYSNIDNIGQQAFNIIHNLNNLSCQQFAEYFTSARHVYSRVTGEEIPLSSIQENYSDLQQKAKQYAISWNKTKYLSFKYYSPVEENGVLGYKGRVYLQHGSMEFNIVVVFIQYEGRYYILSIY